MSDSDAHKRDLDLIREILLWAEKGSPAEEAPDASPDKMTQHVELLVEAKYVVATFKEINTRHGPVKTNPRIIRITWDGFEFLDAARNDGYWKRAKAECIKAGFSAPVEVLKGCLIGLIRGNG